MITTARPRAGADRLQGPDQAVAEVVHVAPVRLGAEPGPGQPGRLADQRGQEPQRVGVALDHVQQAAAAARPRGGPARPSGPTCPGPAARAAAGNRPRPAPSIQSASRRSRASRPAKVRRWNSCSRRTSGSSQVRVLRRLGRRGAGALASGPPRSRLEPADVPLDRPRRRLARARLAVLQPGLVGDVAGPPEPAAAGPSSATGGAWRK